MSIKNVFLQWWITQTWVSPNKFNVIKKRLEIGVYDEKPTHFLLETHVCLHLLNCLVASISCMGQTHFFLNSYNFQKWDYPYYVENFQVRTLLHSKFTYVILMPKNFSCLLCDHLCCCGYLD
jgi:hypothetical protein